jgi:ribosomal protein L23
MDLMKSRVYGFPRHYLTYKIYDPTKYRYLKSKHYGYFEAPRRTRIPELYYLTNQYRQRLEYERMMNPRGHKLSMTSNFPKTGPTIDFLQPKQFFLTRSQKEYKKNELKFLVNKNWSKFEIKQFLQKLYRLNPKKIHTAILPGDVRVNNNSYTRKFFRTPDRKKAVVEFGFETPDSFRVISSIEERDKYYRLKKAEEAKRPRPVSLI